MTRLDELVVRHAEAHPDRRAVWDRTTCLAYGDLVHESDRIAAAIRYHVGGDIRSVALAMERSVAFVAAVLAVLRVGAAYCPIDPSEPSRRRSLILDDCGADLVVVDCGSDEIAAITPMPALDIDHIATLDYDCDRRPRNLPPSDIAYILFTSGSTGRPKGVQGRHAGVIARLDWMDNVYPLENDETFVLKSTPTFVDSVWDIFQPLTRGCGLVILSAEEVCDPEIFVRRLAEERVTRVSLVPSHLAVLLERFPDLGDRLPSLRLLDVTGEAFPGALLARAVASFRDVTILNRYGTTEAPSTLCFDARRHDPSVHGSEVSLGMPISGTSAWVAQGNVLRGPAPGLHGELCLGGAQLAASYLDAEATRQRFVTLRDVTGVKHHVYRTGDRVVVASDGTLCNRGRSDREVQLGGRRVDLHEVEAVLADHPQVRAAAVIVQAGGGTLGALIVSADEGEAESLKSYMDSLLPPHMVPVVYRRAVALPTLPSGKIDYEEVAKTLDRRLDVPADPVLAVLARHLPGVEVTPNDRLASLGVDSLLAMQLVVDLERALGADVTPGQVLGATVEQLQHIGGSPVRAARLKRPALVNTQITEARACRQQELFFRIDEALGPDRHAYHDIWAISFTGELDGPRLLDSVEALVDRYPSFRTGVRQIGAKVMQTVVRPSSPELAYLDLSSRPAAVADREIESLATRIKTTPYDLAGGPLLRAHVVKRSNNDHVLLLGTHHITNDAWSARCLNRSLGELYNQLGTGVRPTPALSEKVPYADYGAWQWNLLETGHLDEQMCYWGRKLRGIESRLALRAHRMDAPTYEGRTVTRQYSDELRERVRRHAAELGVGEFTYYLANFAVLTADRLAETDDLVIGSPTALRQYGDLLDTVGFFANMLPYRISVRWNETFNNLVKRVQLTCEEALDNQEAPFLNMLEDLGFADAGPHPVTNVTFSMPNVNERIGEAINIPGVEVSLLDWAVPPTMSKFDFSLAVHARESRPSFVSLHNRHLYTEQEVSELLECIEGQLWEVSGAPGLYVRQLCSAAAEAGG